MLCVNNLKTICIVKRMEYEMYFMQTNNTYIHAVGRFQQFVSGLNGSQNTHFLVKKMKIALDLMATNTLTTLVQPLTIVGKLNLSVTS